MYEKFDDIEIGRACRYIVGNREEIAASCTPNSKLYLSIFKFLFHHRVVVDDVAPAVEGDLVVV